VFLVHVAAAANFYYWPALPSLSSALQVLHWRLLTSSPPGTGHVHLVIWRICSWFRAQFKNTRKTFWGKSMSKTFGRKSYDFFFLSYFPIDFFNRVFGRFSA
jgi:hypothetical protein